jgi:hypothetical protein
MRCLRRRRSFNRSGHDGVASVRAGGLRKRSSYPFWMGMLFIWATLLGAVGASDSDEYTLDLTEDSACSAATTQPANSPDNADNAPMQPPKCPDPVEADPAEETERIDNRPEIVFHNRSLKKSYIVKFYEPQSCICTGGSLNASCIAMFMDVRWSDLCRNLGLDPNGLVHDDTTGVDIDLVYPAEEEDATGQWDYADPMEDYADNPDVFAWYDHCEAAMRIPLHKEHVPGFIREYELSGAPLLGPDEGEQVDMDDEVCQKANEDDRKTGEKADAYDKANDANWDEWDEGEKADACADDWDEGEKADACADEGEKADACADEGEKADACCEDDLEDDTYECKLHTDMDNFLRFKLYPLELRGTSKEDKRRRKIWGQNARRRYQLRHMADTNQERYATLLSLCLTCMSLHVIHN